MLFAARLPGQCQTFIDVLYQFVFKGNFLPEHRISTVFQHVSSIRMHHHTECLH